MTRLRAKRQQRARRRQAVYNVVVTLGLVVMLVMAVFWFLQGRAHDPLASAGVPVPSPTTDPATPTPATRSPRPGDEPTGKILYELQQRVIRGAGVAAPTSAGCDRQISGLRDETAACTVNYAGLKVVYQVRVTGGSPYFTWRATTESGVLTRAGVYRAFWQQYGQKGGDVRCDADIPVRRLQPLGQVTGFFCYYEPDGYSRNTRRMAVRLGDGQVAFAAVRQ